MLKRLHLFTYLFVIGFNSCLAPQAADTSIPIFQNLKKLNAKDVGTFIAFWDDKNHASTILAKDESIYAAGVTFYASDNVKKIYMDTPLFKKDNNISFFQGSILITNTDTTIIYKRINVIEDNDDGYNIFAVFNNVGVTSVRCFYVFTSGPNINSYVELPPVYWVA